MNNDDWCSSQINVSPLLLLLDFLKFVFLFFLPWPWYYELSLLLLSVLWLCYARSPSPVVGFDVIVLSQYHSKRATMHKEEDDKNDVVAFFHF
jgi:hypothetical protein